MVSKSTQSETFYSTEWDTILNSLIKYLPSNLPFNLFEISQKEPITYPDLLTGGTAKVEQTYVDITNHLIYNDFAKLHDFQKIILTDKGRQLLDYGSYKKFAKIEKLKQDAEIRDLWVKKNWFWVEFIKVIVGVLVGAGLTLGIQKLTSKKEVTPSQEIKQQVLKSDTTKKGTF